MAKKKMMFAVYKNVNKDSHYYGSIFYSAAFDKIIVGEKFGDNECVLLSSDLEQINMLIDSIPDEVYRNIARGNSTNPDGSVNEALLMMEMWQADFIIANKGKR